MVRTKTRSDARRYPKSVREEVSLERTRAQVIEKLSGLEERIDNLRYEYGRQGDRNMVRRVLLERDMIRGCIEELKQWTAEGEKIEAREEDA